MSHCTKFNFQYSSRKCIIRTFENMGLNWDDDEISFYNSNLEKKLNLNAQNKTPAIVAGKNGFNYFMLNRGHYYELLMEKHNMTSNDEQVINNLANEFKSEYIRASVEIFKEKMAKKGIDCLLEQQDNGWEIRFGNMYEKSIFVKLNDNLIEEQVFGVKGKSCSSLTEALEDMLSSPDVELNTRWTQEYREPEENDLKMYNLESF